MSKLNKESKNAALAADKAVFARVYAQQGAGWTLEQPPADLTKLCNTGAIRPGKAVDIGCGEGFYSIYLASLGFDVVGIDLSERAIEYARQNANRAGQDVSFEAMDVAACKTLGQQFDFALEWSVLHHIEPSARAQHVDNVDSLLRNGGDYLSVCFATTDDADSHSKFEVSPVGTKLYYSTARELRDLFEPRFRIVETKSTTIHGRHGQRHHANYFFLQKHDREPGL
jgi:2-polyprenyl-3-methyl-5-hydroxy-6-metoxy-1,4-benzoquinol methylase